MSWVLYLPLLFLYLTNPAAYKQAVADGASCYVLASLSPVTDIGRPGPQPMCPYDPSNVNQYTIAERPRIRPR